MGSPRRGLALVYLALAAAAVLGAARHQAACSLYPDDDIGRFVSLTPRPANWHGVRRLGTGAARCAPGLAPAVGGGRTEQTLVVARITELRQQEGWQPVSGRVRLVVEGRLPGLHTGDEVDVVGRLQAPRGPCGTPASSITLPTSTSRPSTPSPRSSTTPRAWCA